MVADQFPIADKTNGQGQNAAGGATTTGAGRPSGTQNGTAIPGGNGGGTTPSAGVSMTTDANGNPVTQADAIAILSQELSTWGFGQDAITWATQQIQSNNSVDQILFSLRQQPFYVNSIFGQVAAARQQAGLPAMNEAQILAYKDYATGLAQQAGLPAGFMTDAELTTLMGRDVSTSELDARITQGYVDAMKASPDVIHQMHTYYGVGYGGLAAYYLDPSRALPLLQQQFASAQIGAQAGRTGFGAIGQQTAMELAKLGVTNDQARTGFTDLAKQAQLFNALPGSGEQGIQQSIQLAAEFGGNGADQQLIEQRKNERLAQFAGSYRFAETQGRGITGLGSAPRNG